MPSEQNEFVGATLLPSSIHGGTEYLASSKKTWRSLAPPFFLGVPNPNNSELASRAGSFI
jgi:hypothetical protein